MNDKKNNSTSLPARLYKYRWTVPSAIVPLSILCLLLAPETDANGEYSRALGNVLVFFLRVGIAAIAALIVTGYAKDFKGLFGNIILCFVPLTISYYLFGWTLVYYHPLGWSHFFEDTSFGLIFYPFLYAVPSIVTAVLLCIVAGAACHWGFKKNGFRHLNFYAREILLWGGSIYFFCLLVCSFC